MRRLYRLLLQCLLAALASSGSCPAHEASAASVTPASSLLQLQRSSWSPQEIPFVTLVSVACTAYLDWQTVTLHSSWRAAKLPGRLVRLVACSHPAASRDLSGLEGLESHFHEPADASYPPLNRPLGLESWLREGSGKELPADAVLLILDPDMVFYKSQDVGLILAPLIQRLHTGNADAIAYDYGYTTKGLQIRNWTLAKHFGISDFSSLQAAGVPMLHRKGNLQRLTKQYYNITKTIATSSSLSALVHDGNQPSPWIAEMVGYTLATAFLHHETQKDWPQFEEVQTPFGTEQNATPLVVHYDHSFHLCGRAFGKAYFYEKDILDCALPAAELADLQPPSRQEVASSSCELCVKDGDSFGTPPSCGLSGRDFSIFAWEQVHGAVMRWRGTHC